MGALPRWLVACYLVISVVSIIYVDAALHVPHLQRFSSTFQTSSSSSTVRPITTTTAMPVSTSAKSGPVIGIGCEYMGEDRNT